MVYIINNYNGSQLVGINDKTVNNTATSLRLPGREYKPYGEVVVENLVWMLQHFNGATPPLNPIQGQVWYDSSNQELKVWTGSSWINTGKTIIGTQLPSAAQVGQLFYNLSKKQMFVYDNTGHWNLINPVGASDLTDPAPSATIAFTDSQVFTVTDGSSINHSIVRMSVQGYVVAVWSGESFTTPLNAIPGFTPTVIKKGLNMQPGFVLEGEVALATTATNSLNLGGVPSASWMRLDQSNTPVNANVDIGSVIKPFKSMYATNFYGLASAASTAATRPPGDASTQIANTQFVTSALLVAQPTGVIQEFAGAVAPTGWLLCDGSAVSRSTYLNLFNVIGDIYGGGDGTTTFNVPDRRGRFGLGVNGSYPLGATGGSFNSGGHALTLDEMPIHSHTGTTSTDGDHNHTVYGTVRNSAPGLGSGSTNSFGEDSSTSTNGAHSHTLNINNAGGGLTHSHTVTQPYLAVNFIIKT